MNLTVSVVEEEDALEALLPLLERGAQSTHATYAEEPCAEGTAAAFLERNRSRTEAIVLAAREESGTAVAVAASGSFVDPLTGERLPMLSILYVEPRLRHRGVARALVEEMRRRLERRGFSAFLARAAHNDDVLISMGERLGLVRSFEVMSSE